MKKFTLVAGLAAVLFAANNTAQAQLSIRPEIGGNMATLTGDIDDAKMIFGIKGGAYFKIPITSGLYVEPGILFSGKGSKESSEISVPGGMSSKSESTLHLNYIEVPINIGYQFSFGGGYDDNGSGLFVYVGPYIGYGIGGKNKYENTTTISIPGMDSTVTTSGDDKVKFGSDANQYKALDFGLNIGAGYQFSFGLYVRAQYGLGFGNLSNDNSVKVHNNTISLAIGYNINLGGGGRGW